MTIVNMSVSSPLVSNLLVALVTAVQPLAKAEVQAVQVPSELLQTHFFISDPNVHKLKNCIKAYNNLYQWVIH